MRHDETQAHSDSADPIDDLLAAVLLAQSSGQGIDRDRLLREHPEHAEELASFLDDYGSLDERFAPLRDIASSISRLQAESPTIGREDTLAPTPQAGSTFGGYELLTEIARGGMGVVYKARQRSLNRIVALKMVLGSRREGSIDRDRFLAEAKAVARLSHPHIVPIYEVGEHDGQPYFTMQFIAGGSLRERQEEFRHDQRAIADLVATVARAVEHAHRRGILHRDIKPSNVLLDDKRQPHVTDFGLAKQLDDDSNLTQAGAVVGTPSYMAPEQAGGQTDVCTAVDVYGLGAVLYELLTGQPPFKGETPMETLLQVMQQEPKPPRQLVSSIDPDLETIALKCLEKDPGRRYGSAEAVADDLDRWSTDQPILARPVTRTERLLKWSRRQPLAAGSLAMTAMVAMALLIASGFLWRNAELRAQAVQDLGQARGELAQAVKQQEKAAELVAEQTRLADEQRKLADEQKSLADKVKAEVARLEKAAQDEKEKAVAARESARVIMAELESARLSAHRTTYAADMQLASAAWQTDNVGLVQTLVDRYRDRRAELDLRGFEWSYFDRRLHVAEQSWSQPLANTEILVGMDVSPDGKLVATALVTGKVIVSNLADGSLVKRFDVPDVRLAGVFFEGDGRKLTAVIRKNPYDFRRMGSVIYPAMLKKAKFSLRDLTDCLEFVSWTLDGDQPGSKQPFEVARIAAPLQLAQASALFVQHEGEAVMVVTINGSPNGRYLAMTGTAVLLDPTPKSPKVEFQGGRLLLWDQQQGSLAAFQKTSSMAGAIAFSNAKQMLALGYANGNIDLFDEDLAKEPRRIGRQRGTVTSLNFSGDDRQLASGGIDAVVALWDVAEGERASRFVGHQRAVWRAEFTPDAEKIVSADMNGVVKIWDVHFSGEPLLLRGQSLGIISGLSFKTESNELVSADSRGATKTWKLPRGVLLRENAAVGTYNTTVLSREGRMLVARDITSEGSYLVKDLVAGTENTMNWPGRAPAGMVLSADGKYLAIAASKPEGSMAIWSIGQQKQVATLDQFRPQGSPQAFSADGKTLAMRFKNGLVVWNWQTGDARSLFDDKEMPVSAAAFSHDGRLLAVEHAGNVLIWNLQTNQPHSECRGVGANVVHVQFTPDGGRLLTAGVASQQTLVKLWDVASGRETFTPQAIPGLASAIAVSPDGRRLAVAVTPADVFASLTNQPIASDIHVWDASP